MSIIDEGMGHRTFQGKGAILNGNQLSLNVTLQTGAAQQKPKNWFEVRRGVLAKDPSNKSRRNIEFCQSQSI